jgi:hypothetical protein
MQGGMMSQQQNQGPYQHPIHTMEIGTYEEKPRPNLQSVIEKMRENSVSIDRFNLNFFLL